MEPQRREAAFADGTTSYLEWSGPQAAPVLVFLHANGFNALTYRTLLAPLAERFRIIAPDQRGHGFTTLESLPRIHPRWELLRDDLLRLVAMLGVRPRVLAGHSLGATVSLMAAAKIDVADALVVSEPVLQPDSRALYALLMRMLGRAEQLPRVLPAKKRRAQFASREEAVKGYRGRGIFKGWPEQIVADYVEGGTIASEGGGYKLACSPDWESEFFTVFPFGLARLGSRIRVPVTVLAGTEQSATTEDVVSGFVRRHPRTKLRRIPGASHFLPMEKPELVRAEIIEAAQKLVPASASPSSPAVE